MKKNILLSNFYLERMAGSELYTLEISSCFLEMGHNVAVFTFVPGAFSSRMKEMGITIFTQADRDAIEAFKPDIVHIHHLPCLYFLSSLNLGEAPFIYSMLGPTSPLESPPSGAIGINKFLAVSEEVRTEVLKKTDKVKSIELFQNWFDDRNLLLHDIANTHVIGEVKNIAVITNHLDPVLAEYLNQLSKEDLSFRWTHIGLPNNSVEITSEILMPFDAVITIGRSVLFATALPKPVFIHDIHGADGWLTVRNFEHIAKSNFSGRAYGMKLTFEKWKEQLLSGSKEINLAALCLKVRENFCLSKRAMQLISIYNALEKNSLEATLMRIDSCKNEARVFAELGRNILKLKQQVQKLSKPLDFERLSMKQLIKISVKALYFFFKKLIQRE